MKRKITFYYGLTGTFKATTIKKLSGESIDSSVMWSAIKPWKSYSRGIFLGHVVESDLNYAMLHLCRLRDFVNSGKEHIFVERGVTDMLFYYGYVESDWIKDVVQEEMKLLEGWEVEKILLVQQDREFLQSVVLQEGTRAECFPNGVVDVLREQEAYIHFTQHYNDIADTIVISDARDYIEKLGLQWNPGK